MWEFAGPDGKAFIDADGALLCDPGHAAEFVGLGLRLLRCAQRRGLLGKVEPARLARYRQLLSEVLRQNFANGFSPQGLGMVKAYDLIGRKPINDDMPWWNLPETMRAALESARAAPDAQKAPLADIARRCSNAFMANYVRPELGLMAVQTLSAAGKVTPVVPATPDADPGYHTGLSLIDCLNILEETLGQG
jgi:mannose/cellobiose epimerase-like protein (N-acyl-D-glucosamine 2-epimerase family)